MKPARPDRLDPRVRGLLRKTAGALLGLTVLAAFVGIVFREPIVAGGTAFVARWGGPGIALGFFLPDAFALPIPHDLFLALGVAGGMPALHIIAWASLGSILGGCTAWLMAQLVRRIPALDRRLAHRGAEMRELLERYGTLGLAAGALTPLPYSLLAWTCGVLGMPFRTFFAVSLLRIVRVASYLGFVALGLVTAG